VQNAGRIFYDPILVVYMSKLQLIIVLIEKHKVRTITILFWKGCFYRILFNFTLTTWKKL